MRLDSVRFRGLHVVDLSRLTDHQKEFFGDEKHLTKKGIKAVNDDKPVKSKHWKSTFPDNKRLYLYSDIQKDIPGKIFTQSFSKAVHKIKISKEDGRLLGENITEKDIMVLYSRLDAGEQFEAHLRRYIKEFEKKYNHNQKIPHVFDPSIAGEKIDFDSFKDKERKEEIKLIPGLEQALEKLDSTGDLKNFFLEEGRWERKKQ